MTPTLAMPLGLGPFPPIKRSSVRFCETPLQDHCSHDFNSSTGRRAPRPEARFKRGTEAQAHQHWHWRGSAVAQLSPRRTQQNAELPQRSSPQRGSQVASASLRELMKLKLEPLKLWLYPSTSTRSRLPARASNILSTATGFKCSAL